MSELVPSKGEGMSWLRRLFSRKVEADELSQEIRQHIEEKIEELVAGGKSRGEAEHAARREFGNVTLIERDSRDVWRWLSIENFLMDVRFGFRMLWRSKSFTLAAVLTLALGVGANLAIFAVFEAVMLRPLPYSDAERLVILNHRDQETGIQKEFIAIGDYVDLASRQGSFEALSGYGSEQKNVSEAAETYRVSALLGSSDLLQTLRVRPLMGRDLRPEDTREHAQPVELISYDLWQRRFGGDPNIIGRGMEIGTDKTQIVGVLPPGFRFPPSSKTELLLPLTLPIAPPADRKSNWTFVVARLKPGVTFASAAVNLRTISQDLAKEYPQSNQHSEYVLLALRDALVGESKPLLTLLLGAVGVVLLIACLNVSNLLLARLLGRRRELAVRVALGGGRGQIATQLLAESLALAVVASMLALLAANWGTRLLVALVPKSIDAPGMADVRLSGPVLLFAIGITGVATLVFTLISTITVKTRNVYEALLSGTRSTSGPGARRAASALIAGEIAMAIVLLMAAGLILRSFARLVSVDPGFRTENVATLEMTIPEERYKDAVSSRAFYDRAFAAVRSLPQVREVGAAVVVPLTGNNWTEGFERAEFPVPEGERPPEVGWQLASGGFFRTLQIPLLAGRLFDSSDVPDGKPVVIVSRALERTYFPGESAVGHAVKVGSTLMEVVGVVGDIHRAQLRDQPRPDMYFPFEMRSMNQITLFVRVDGNAGAMIPGLKNALRSLEPTIAFGDSGTMNEIVSESLQLTRLALWLLGFFAATALALAATGIYGVMSYGVRQRTREIGTRIALGASRAKILYLVMRQAAGITVCGTVAGLAVGLFAVSALRSMLYGVSTTDPMTIAAATTLVLLIAALACGIPAKQASSVDPARTLAEP